MRVLVLKVTLGTGDPSSMGVECSFRLGRERDTMVSAESEVEARVEWEIGEKAEAVESTAKMLNTLSFMFLFSFVSL